MCPEIAMPLNSTFIDLTQGVRNLISNFDIRYDSIYVFISSAKSRYDHSIAVVDGFGLPCQLERYPDGRRLRSRRRN
jgi:hypothetical protein